MIPEDPIILLSFINTNLRDNYPELEELCRAINADKDEIIKKLSLAGYSYDRESNSFK